MPTGYTEKVRSGEMTSFKDFAYRCTRAMGVAVLQRDDSLDTPLKEDYEPDLAWRESSLNKSYSDLIEAVAWTPEEAQSRAEESYRSVSEERAASLARRQEDADRYRAMLDKVNAWTPPTEEHNGLKKFMVEQLEESIRFDGPSKYDTEELPLPDGEQYRKEQITHAQRLINHYSEEIKKEIERAEGRNAWIAEFKKSVENLD